jgi:hypothetical protein
MQATCNYHQQLFSTTSLHASLSLMFTYEGLGEITIVKVIGRQWYWQYALKESVDLSLKKQTDKFAFCTATR